MMEEIQKRVKVREFINTSYDFCTGSHVGPDTIRFVLSRKRPQPSVKGATRLTTAVPLYFSEIAANSGNTVSFFHA